MLPCHCFMSIQLIYLSVMDMNDPEMELLGEFYA